jgi:hypothetical protein
VIREVPGALEAAAAVCTARDYRDPGNPKIYDRKPESPDRGEPAGVDFADDHPRAPGAGHQAIMTPIGPPPITTTVSSAATRPRRTS